MLQAVESVLNVFILKLFENHSFLYFLPCKTLFALPLSILLPMPDSLLIGSMLGLENNDITATFQDCDLLLLPLPNTEYFITLDGIS